MKAYLHEKSLEKMVWKGCWGINYHGTVLAPLAAACNHTDENGNSIHSVKWFAYWSSTQILEQRPNLGLLRFPHSSLNSHLTYGQYHIAHCLVMQSSIVWVSKQIGSSICDRDHCYINHVSPTMPFIEVAMLTCIHSSIHSPTVYWETICARIHSTDMLRIWTVQNLYSSRA